MKGALWAIAAPTKSDYASDEVRVVNTLYRARSAAYSDLSWNEKRVDEAYSFWRRTCILQVPLLSMRVQMTPGFHWRDFR